MTTRSINLVSDHPLESGVLVKAGDRIAQAMIVPAPRVTFDAKRMDEALRRHLP